MPAEITNYAFYDNKWTVSNSVPPVTSINAKPGYSWVSLSWTPPAGGLGENLAGYVVCRSVAGAAKAPQYIGDSGSSIVHITNGTHFGDLPLSNNTPDLMTADAGLKPNTLYWYSVFVVTTIPPQPKKTFFPEYTRGNISPPVSIQVMTSNTLPTNILSEQESNFQTFISNWQTATSGWQVGYVSGNASALTGGFPPGSPSTPVVSNTTIDPNDPIININGSPLFTEYMTLTMAQASCLGLCNTKNFCCVGSDCSDGTDPNCQPPNTPGTPCSCQGSSAYYTKIYYTYSPPEGFIPGTLYSFSVWFRTNNPIPALAAVNGNDQAYTPIISAYGNSEPNSPAPPATKIPQPLGITQIEQVMVNEQSAGLPVSGSAIACSPTDSVSCTRTPAIGGGLNSAAYSAVTSLWQRASLTFIIGSGEQSIITTTYNFDGTSGDPIQLPFKTKSPGTALPSGSFDSITISIEIPQNAPGNDLGVMDFANAELYEGLLPYTDPFWNIKPGDNLIFNPDFWGVQTLTQGTVAAGWVCPPAIGMTTDTIACGPICNGNCITCQATGPNPTTGDCINTCTGTCDSNNICSTNIGNCLGSCTGICAPALVCVGGTGSCLPKCTGTCHSDGTCLDNSGTCEPLCTGTCGPDPTRLCTGTTGSCPGTCSMEGATCTNSGSNTGATGTCGGTCTGNCVFTPPSCKSQDPGGGTNCTCTCNDEGHIGEPCYWYEDATTKVYACYLGNGATICKDNDHATTMTCTGGSKGAYCEPPSFNCDGGNNGTCTGSCNDTCSSTCPGGTGTCTNTGKMGDPCTGTCTSNNGICQSGTGSCAGGTICYNTSIDPYKNITNNAICGSTTDDYTTYFVLQSCSCQHIQLQQGNIVGLSGYYTGSYSLAPNTTYTFSFDGMILDNDNPTNAITVNIFDMTYTIPLDSGDPICDKSGKTGCSASFPQSGKTFPVAPNLPETTFTTYSFNFTTSDLPVNPNITLNIYKANLRIAIKNLSLKAMGGEYYGIQNPFPTIVTPPSTTKENLANDAIIWQVPNDVSIEDCPQSILFNETAQLSDGTQLGWPQGLVLMNAFHTNPTMDRVAIVPDTIAASAYGINNVMAITVSNLNSDVLNPDQSAFLMSNAYYGSGQWDIWVRIANVFEIDNVTPIMDKTNPDQPANPTGCSFAFWIYHAISYEVAGGPKLLYEPNALRNTEIDIEMNGACPDYSDNFTNNTGRLNGWGGQWGGSGANFTMHTQMPANSNSPNGINLNDGKYHKLSILFHSGTDPIPNQLDPNGAYPMARAPGFVKWFVDDVEWGCGWTGNTYGLDNIPMTATRIVAGPWNPDWAGCKLCCDNCPNNTNAGDLRSGCCAGGCPTSFGNPDIPVPTCNKWGSAVFNVAKLQFTPTCTDCELPCTTGMTCKNPYYPAVALPSRPDASVLPPGGDKVTSSSVNSIGPSNRNRWLPETKGYLTFPTSCCDGNGNCCTLDNCTPNQTDCSGTTTKGNACN